MDLAIRHAEVLGRSQDLVVESGRAADIYVSFRDVRDEMPDSATSEPDLVS
jgi:hypothetical protein